MKNILCLILIIVLAFMAVSCGCKSDDPTDDTENEYIPNPENNPNVGMVFVDENTTKPIVINPYIYVPSKSYEINDIADIDVLIPSTSVTRYHLIAVPAAIDFMDVIWKLNEADYKSEVITATTKCKIDMADLFVGPYKLHLLNIDKGSIDYTCDLNIVDTKSEYGVPANIEKITMYVDKEYSSELGCLYIEMDDSAQMSENPVPYDIGIRINVNGGEWTEIDPITPKTTNDERIFIKVFEFWKSPELSFTQYSAVHNILKDCISVNENGEGFIDCYWNAIGMQVKYLPKNEDGSYVTTCEWSTILIAHRGK